MIDWGDARIGDPAIDYAWLLNGPFPDWDVDGRAAPPRPDLPPARPWFEVHYGDFTDQPDWVESGLRGVRERL